MKKTKQGLLTLLRVLGLVLPLSFSVGCNSRVLMTLPREMEGVWTTDDPRFQGRFMELSPSFVIIVTGHEDPATVQFVDKVETQTPGDLSSLTVYLPTIPRAPTTRCLQFSPANGGQLRFQNQGLVWRRGRQTAN
jgi:hypothetical protein